MVFKISCCLLALLVNISASPSFDSGLLSRLYKKAASENRPLILVLDGTSKDRDGDNDDDSRVHRHRELDEDAERNKDVPSSLLDLLNQKRQPSKSENRQSLHEHGQDHRENRYKQNDLSRLKYRLEKELKDRRERREKKIREKGQDRDDIIYYKAQEKKRDWNQDRNRYRHQDRHQDRNQDRKRYRNQDRNQDRTQDRQDRDEDSKIRDSKALRSSVIRNLLRTYNDLNCEARDECEDECNGKNNKDACEDKCEKKYTCEEEVKLEEDPCIVNDKDECASDVDEVRSTRGERLEIVTEKCKRC